MSRKKSNQVKVSTYYVGMHFAVCSGIADAILSIRVDTKELLDAPITADGLTYINRPELFGGTSREGGITGNLETQFGSPSQSPSTYLQSCIGEAIPAYRGITSAILQQMYIGLNYYMKPWEFALTRISKRSRGTPQWYPAKMSPIVNEINAVHVLRECLTDDEWGLGEPESSIDTTSWENAAFTCHEEGLGFSFLWDKESSIEDFIQEVSKHIQASVYRDRFTGLWMIKLIRYETPDTSTFQINEDNLVTIQNLSRKSLTDLISEIQINYENNGTYDKASYTAKNISLISRQGGSVLQTINYSGISTQRVAKIIGDRDLQQLGLPVFSGSLLCSREAEILNPGDMFSLELPEVFGTSKKYFRVKNINFGTAKDEAIAIDFIEDFFNIAPVVFSDVPGYDYEETRWRPTTAPPVPITALRLYEIPYYAVALWQGDAEAQAVLPMETGYIVAAKSPTPASIEAELWSTLGSTYTKNGTTDFSYWAELTSAVDRVSTTLHINTVEDISSLTIGSFAVLGDELVYVSAIDTILKTIEVKRGILDTVPEIHPIGTTFAGIEDFHGLDRTKYFAGDTVSVKNLTVTSQGTLPLASAPVNTITLSGRMHLPYPPGNLLIEGIYWNPERPAVSLSLNWAHRNRYLQTAEPFSYYTDSVTSESGVLYTVSLYDDTVLIATLETFTTSCTLYIPAHTFITFGRLEVKSTNSNGDCFQKVIHNFTSAAASPVRTFDGIWTFDSSTTTMDNNL